MYFRGANPFPLSICLSFYRHVCRILSQYLGKSRRHYGRIEGDRRGGWQSGKEMKDEERKGRNKEVRRMVRYDKGG